MNEIMILNKPDYADDYEFIVARKIDGQYYYYGAYRWGYEADNTASAFKNGVVFHNVRIQGKKRK